MFVGQIGPAPPRAEQLQGVVDGLKHGQRQVLVAIWDCFTTTADINADNSSSASQPEIARESRKRGVAKARKLVGQRHETSPPKAIGALTKCSNNTFALRQMAVAK
jgi:hypothetical protein